MLSDLFRKSICRSLDHFVVVLGWGRPFLRDSPGCLRLFFPDAQPQAGVSMRRVYIYVPCEF